VSRYRFIEVEKVNHAVRTLCRVLKVSRAAYYNWSIHPLSAHARADLALTERIAAIHARSRQTYGSPRIHAELRACGGFHRRKRVTRLMHRAGLAGRFPRRYRRTTIGDPFTVLPDLVQRDFTPTGPDQLWVGDITHVRTWEGWLYPATIPDCFSRRVVGWAMADHRRTELPLGVLGQRRRRELLLHAQARPALPAQLADPRGREERHLRVHRELLQPCAPAHDTRQPQSGRLRIPARTRSVFGLANVSVKPGHAWPWAVNCRGLRRVSRMPGTVEELGAGMVQRRSSGGKAELLAPFSYMASAPSGCAVSVGTGTVESMNVAEGPHGRVVKESMPAGVSDESEDIEKARHVRWARLFGTATLVQCAVVASIWWTLDRSDMSLALYSGLAVLIGLYALLCPGKVADRRIARAKRRRKMLDGSRL